VFDCELLGGVEEEVGLLKSWDEQISVEIREGEDKAGGLIDVEFTDESGG